MTRLDLVGFGALNVDLVYRVPDLSVLRRAGLEAAPGRETVRPREELPHLLALLASAGRLVAREGGGSAANTAVACARLGLRAGVVGRVGADEDGDFLLGTMAGLDLRGVVRAGRTGWSLVVLGPEGDRCIFVFPGTNEELGSGDVDLSFLSAARVVHLSSLVGPGPRLAQQEAVAALPPEVVVSLDPGEIYARLGAAALEGLLRRTAFLLTTAEEVAMLTGREWEEGARELLGFGPEVVVVRRGALGATIFTARREWAVPPVPTEVVDTTGAGDVFNAAFLAGFLRGHPLEECGRLAARAAAASLKGYGRTRYPGPEVFDGRNRI
ncbi:MAG: carbohydrate kinase family protein [Desulfotomaculales bacterium]